MDTTFPDYGISPRLAERLSAMGITTPTPVQRQAMPLVAEGRNLLFQSETGTGKTFAYLLPLAQRLEAEEDPRRSVRLIIASPTYELASQIKAQAQRVTDLKCVLCIGGAPLARQIESLREKPAIVIGGPARLLELIHLKKLKADAVQALVLDEADRLLSPELRDGTRGLLERLPRRVQLIGNSATVSDYTRRILQQARDGLGGGDPVQLLMLPPEDVLRSRITHWALFAERRDKIDTLRSLIRALGSPRTLVFASRPDQVENITAKLRYRGIQCAALTGKTEKKERKAAIDRFRSGKLPVLITTDLASRGIDIADIAYVVQMDMPEEADFFIHRAGRTARAGRTGVNCVIGDAREMRDYARIEKKLKITVHPKILYGGRVEVPAQQAEPPRADGQVLAASAGAPPGAPARTC